MIPRTRSGLASLGLAALLTATTAGAVGATTTDPSATSTTGSSGACATEWSAARANPSVTTFRAVGDCEIARRFTTLGRLDAMVAGSAVITAAHKSELRFTNATDPTSIQATHDGLASLKATIDAEASLPALRAEIGRIATDYRVYLLVAPKTYLVRGSDATSAAIARFAPLEAELQAEIAQAKAAGKDTSAAEAADADLASKVTQATGLVGPLAGQLLPITVAQYDAGTGRPILVGARSTIGAARDLLRAARADAAEIVHLLSS